MYAVDVGWTSLEDEMYSLTLYIVIGAFDLKRATEYSYYNVILFECDFLFY